MTDRLQQKAEEIVHRWLNVSQSSAPLTPEYAMVMAGLTAGIAMAAEEELWEQIRKEVIEELRRDPTTLFYNVPASKIIELIHADAALAKGETQHG